MHSPLASVHTSAKTSRTADASDRRLPVKLQLKFLQVFPENKETSTACNVNDVNVSACTAAKVGALRLLPR